MRQVLQKIIDRLQRLIVWCFKFSLLAFGVCVAIIIFWEIREFLIAPIGIKESSGPQPKWVSGAKEEGWWFWLIALVAFGVGWGILENLKEKLKKTENLSPSSGAASREMNAKD